MGAAGEMFLLAASRLVSAGRRHGEPSSVEALLERLDYLRDGQAALDHDQQRQVRNRAAILRAAALVSGLFAAESPDARGARFFCGTADPQSLGKAYRVFPAVSVAGCDHSPGRAFERCIGEAVEYLSQLSTPDDPPSTAEDGVRWAEEVPFEAGEAHLRAVALGSGAEVALPARLCLRMPENPEALAGAGCAAGPTWTEAVSAGLWELIERDAVAAWWHGGHPPGLLHSDIVQAASDYAARMRRGVQGRWTIFFDISCRQGLPVVAACSFADRGGGFAAGFAAHPDALEAARKAVRELMQMELGLRFVEAKRVLGSAPLNQAEHVQLLRAERVTPDHPALRARGAAREFERPPEAASPDEVLRTTVRRLHALGVEAYATDLTRHRFHIPVAKVIAPGLRQIPDEAAWAAVGPAHNIPLF